MSRTIMVLGAAVVLALAAWFAIDREGDSTPRSGSATSSSAAEPILAPSPLDDGSARAELGAGLERAEVRAADRGGQSPAVDGAMVTIRVRVIDWRGNPAVGVPVGIGVLGKKATGPRVTRASETDGLVAFGAGEFAKENEVIDSIYVCAIGPLHPLPRAELRWSELPPDPVELRLPPFGSVRVRFDSLGTGLGGDGVSLSVKDVSNDPFPVRNSAKGTLREGEAVFAMVGLDHKLKVSVSVRGANVWPSESFDGPRADGQEVVVEVPIITTGTLAGFRLIDEKANVLGSRDLEFRIES